MKKISLLVFTLVFAQGTALLGVIAISLDSFSSSAMVVSFTQGTSLAGPTQTQSPNTLYLRSSTPTGNENWISSLTNVNVSGTIEGNSFSNFAFSNASGTDDVIALNFVSALSVGDIVDPGGVQVTVTGTFDFSAISGLELSWGNARFDFNAGAQQGTTVPEPKYYAALFAFASLGFVVVRRIRQK